MAKPASGSDDAGKKTGMKKTGLFAGLGLVVLLGAGGALYVSMTHKGPTAVAKKTLPPVHYTALNRFVSNLASDGSLHYIEVTVELKSRLRDLSTKVAHDRPEIRDAILNILADQTLPGVTLPAGRKALRRKILYAVNDILLHKTWSPGVAADAKSSQSSPIPGTVSTGSRSGRSKGPILGVYFTAFVVQ